LAQPVYLAWPFASAQHRHLHSLPAGLGHFPGPLGSASPHVVGTFKTNCFHRCKSVFQGICHRHRHSGPVGLSVPSAQSSPIPLVTFLGQALEPAPPPASRSLAATPKPPWLPPPPNLKTLPSSINRHPLFPPLNPSLNGLKITIYCRHITPAIATTFDHHLRSPPAPIKGAT
jgi:hypothetical protein